MLPPPVVVERRFDVIAASSEQRSHPLNLGAFASSVFALLVLAAITFGHERSKMPTQASLFLRLGFAGKIAS